MPSMPRLARPEQHNHTEGPTGEVVLGVDTPKDAHVAAVITVWECCWPARHSRRPPPATGTWRPGRVRSERCGGRGWSAPVPTERR